MKKEYFFIPSGYSSSAFGPFEIDEARKKAEEYASKNRTSVMLLHLINVVKPKPLEVEWNDDGWTQLT